MRRRRWTLTIVASHKSITIAPPHLAVHKLPRALEGDVHVAINGLEFAYVGRSVSITQLIKPTERNKCTCRASRTHTLVDNARVQFYCHGSTNDLAEETGRVAGVVCCWGGGVGAVGCGGGHCCENVKCSFIVLFVVDIDMWSELMVVLRFRRPLPPSKLARCPSGL